MRQAVFALVPVLSMFVAAPPATVAATYHVSARQGSDSNPGTPDRPFKTIAAASRVLKPGDTALIRKGVYHEQIMGGASGTEGAPIVYEGVDPEEVILRGSVKVDRWEPLGLCWMGRVSPRPNRANFFVMVDEKSMLKEVGSHLNMPEGSYHVTDSGKLFIRLWGDANPNETRGIDVYRLDMAFNAGSRWGGTAKKWIVLRNLVLEKYGGHPISTDSTRPSDNSHWELDRISVRLNNNEGVFHCLDDWYVHDCKFVRNRGHGYQINGARVRFLNNLAAENEWLGAYPDGGCGLLIGPDASAHSCVVKNNVFENNGHRDGYGCGIYLEGRSRDNLIEGNLISGNVHAGIGLYGSSHNRIINNVLVNVGPDLDWDSVAAFVIGHSHLGEPTQSVGNLIAHNTVWRCSAPLAAFKPTSKMEGPQLNGFVNNLFFDCRSVHPVPETYGVVMENNGWFACPRSDSVKQEGWKKRLSALRRILESGGQATEDKRPVTGPDPALRDPEGGDFRPSPGSPLIDAGMILESVNTDRDGRVRPSGPAPDIGAYEWQPQAN